MTYDETLAHIFSRGRFGMKPGLERVTEILARLGNPHEKLKAVQIAGTNGKGSTGAFLSSILTAAGYRTAFFSSPHLMRFSERFRINETEVSEETLHEAALRVLAVAPAEATFFEIVTAIAFLLFAEAEVDLAIMEAGMGGRWDATNVAKGVLAIITPISLDHCASLGNTVALIAAEKAGIIKAGAPVVIGPQEPDALLPLTAAAGRLNLASVSPWQGFPDGGITCRFCVPGGRGCPGGAGACATGPVSACKRCICDNCCATPWQGRFSSGR